MIVKSRENTDSLKRCWMDSGWLVDEFWMNLGCFYNTFVMFLNTNKSVHGVTPRENALHDRLSINIIAEAEKKLGPLFKLNEIVQ